MRRRCSPSYLLIASILTLPIAILAACDDEEPGCRDMCNLDDRQCSGDLIQVCGEGTDGCLTWLVSHDCGEESGTCVGVGDTVGCEPECSEDCESGALACWDEVVMVCQFDSESGCFTWFVQEECETNGEVCDDSGGTARCGPP